MKRKSPWSLADGDVETYRHRLVNAYVRPPLGNPPLFAVCPRGDCPGHIRHCDERDCAMGAGYTGLRAGLGLAPRTDEGEPVNLYPGL